MHAAWKGMGLSGQCILAEKVDFYSDLPIWCFSIFFHKLTILFAQLQIVAEAALPPPRRLSYYDKINPKILKL